MSNGIIFFSNFYANHNKWTVVHELGFVRQCDTFLGTHRKFEDHLDNNFMYVYKMMLHNSLLCVPSQGSSVHLETSHEQKYFIHSSQCSTCSDFLNLLGHVLVLIFGCKERTCIFSPKRMLILSIQVE